MSTTDNDDSGAAETIATGPDFVEKKVPRLEYEDIPWIYDDAAAKEAQQLSSGDSIDSIRAKAEARESDRAERFKDNFETISIASIWGLFITFGILTVIWAAHLVLPVCWQFLDKAQLDKLQIVITSGFVTGVASSHIKKRLSG